MVKLSAELLVRCSSGYTKRLSHESVLHYLRRLTHAFLEHKSIDEIGDELSSCENLTVLYLYDNCLTAVPHLPRNVRLSALYLQNNNIHRIENLVVLKRLNKLFLAGNEIYRVEGLIGLTQLEELYVENQRLLIGDQLTFEPESIQAVANTLQVLDVSGNSLTSLSYLEPLSQLAQLNASNNKLANITELVHLLGASWRKLRRLDLTLNPLTRLRRYRDRVIIMSTSLETLDGKEITDIERQFLRNWRAARTSHPQRQIEAPPTDAGALVGGGESAANIKSLVPCNNYVMRQRYYYDTAADMVREWQTPRAAVRPSLIQLPELPEATTVSKALSRSVSNPCYRSLPATRQHTDTADRFLNCSGLTYHEKAKRAASFHVG